MKLNKLQELIEKSVKLVTINFHHVAYKHFMGNNILFMSSDYKNFVRFSWSVECVQWVL